MESKCTSRDSGMVFRRTTKVILWFFFGNSAAIQLFSCPNSLHSKQNLYNDGSDDFITETVRGINYSLIGWYLQTYGMQNALAFIEWLGVPLFTSAENNSWLQPVSPLRIENSEETQRRLNSMLDGYDALEKKLNHQFQEKAYLLQSISHESFTSNDLTPNYQGLDFAGDAILNYAIVRHLFRQYPSMSADDLLNICTLLQSNSSLATISVRNEFHTFLRYTAPELRDNVNSFVAFLRRNRCRPVNDVSCN